METPRQGRTQPAAQPDRNAPKQAFTRRIDCAPKKDGEPQHGASHGNGSHRAPGEDA